jgi:hypothetical protein
MESQAHHPQIWTLAHEAVDPSFFHNGSIVDDMFWVCDQPLTESRRFRNRSIEPIASWEFKAQIIAAEDSRFSGAEDHVFHLTWVDRMISLSGLDELTDKACTDDTAADVVRLAGYRQTGTASTISMEIDSGSISTRQVTYLMEAAFIRIHQQ